MADYTVTNAEAYSGNYSAAGAGHIVWEGGGFVFYGDGPRQYYTKDGDATKVIIYDESSNGWNIGDSDYLYLYDMIENSGITPPTGDWGVIHLEEYSPPVHNVSASTGVDFDVDVVRDAMDFNLSAENNIEFEQEVDIPGLIVVVTENDIEFTQEADGYREISVSAETNIEFSQEDYLTYEVEAENNIEFDHENEKLRVIYRDGENAIEFDEATAQVRFGESGLELGHSAEAEATKSVESDIEISDSASREAMPFNRGTENNLQLGHSASAYNENDPSHGPCNDEYTCDRDHITLECVDPVTSVDLRNPADDSLNVILNIINRYSRGEELGYQNSNAGVHPRFLQLHYQFTSMPASQKAAFITFYKATAGLEITLTDFCGQRWLGCIIDKEIGFDREESHITLDPGCPETDEGLYAWSFIFEGERI